MRNSLQTSRFYVKQLFLEESNMVNKFTAIGKFNFKKINVFTNICKKTQNYNSTSMRILITCTTMKFIMLSIPSSFFSSI